MQSRIKKFYSDVEEILTAIDLKGNDNLSPSQNECQVNEINENETNVYNEFADQRREDLLKAVQTGNVEELTNAIEWATIDGCETILKDEIYSANLKLKQQINFERMRESLHNMRPGLISELRSYSKPPKVVYDVMLCVYLLLGVESEDRLKSWSSIQGLMNQSGKFNLKRLIEYRQSSDVPADTVERVKIILSNYDFQQIYLASEGAAAFYVWITETMEDLQSSGSKIDQNQECT